MKEVGLQEQNINYTRVQHRLLKERHGCKGGIRRSSLVIGSLKVVIGVHVNFHNKDRLTT